MSLSLIFVFASVAGLALVVAALIAALWRHKKAGAGVIRLMGETGWVDTQLDPEGTVLVHGELWRAKSSNGSVILSHASVRVVGFQDHLVLVRVCE
jgi:membrane-bound serine protease (ClpP class)